MNKKRASLKMLFNKTKLLMKKPTNFGLGFELVLY